MRYKCHRVDILRRDGPCQHERQPTTIKCHLIDLRRWYVNYIVRYDRGADFVLFDSLLRRVSFVFYRIPRGFIGREDLPGSPCCFARGSARCSRSWHPAALPRGIRCIRSRFGVSRPWVTSDRGSSTSVASTARRPRSPEKRGAGLEIGPATFTRNGRVATADKFPRRERKSETRKHWCIILTPSQEIWYNF